MENQSNQATKKGLILLLGVIIGLLTGVLVAFVVVKKLNFSSPSVVKVIPPSPEAATKDTVYQYIVHQYEQKDEGGSAYSSGDSLRVDTAFVEDYSMDYMLDDDYQEVVRKEDANVTSERLISKYEAPVLYFDASKNPVSAAANAPKFMEVQFWSTPFQNKIVYSFDNNILKIKGLKPNEVCLIHYNNHYYLQSDNRVYQLQPSTAFLRLVEIHDFGF